MSSPALPLLLILLLLLESQRLLVTASDCPLEFSWSNFTLAAAACSDQNERAKCCRYLNAIVTVSVARYSNATGTLGVPSSVSDICINSISVILQGNGIPSTAISFCGLGQKIRVSYQCEGRSTILDMLQTPSFGDVIKNCKIPLSLESSCRRCVNSDIIYLHHLIGAQDNLTLNTCRDAAFVALANTGDNMTALDMANCFFGVQGLSILPANASEPPSLAHVPTTSPSPGSALAPSLHLLGVPIKKHHRILQIALITGIGILVTGVAMLLLLMFILLIHKKSRELNSDGIRTETSCSGRPSLSPKPQGPSVMFRRFAYKEIMSATNNFNNIVERGEVGTVYKAKFHDGFMAAVKRINKGSEQGEEEFSRDTERLGRLHHRQIVALRGYCAEKHERFLVYEYMANGSLKDHLHLPNRSPLGWQTRIQIAIDVANALEYLHFYCDPPRCYGDIKSSNILLDESFLGKVANFGLAHASRRSTISSVPENTDAWETSGYTDPEYATIQKLTEKSDVYSFGVLLLELVSGRPATFDDTSLVEWSQELIASNSKLRELVDPAILDSFNLEQLQAVVMIIQWCTQREGRLRPSIKQVLRVLLERFDPLHSRFTQAIQDEKHNQGGDGKQNQSELVPYHNDDRSLQFSSRSYCSGSGLVETDSPRSPSSILSV